MGMMRNIVNNKQNKIKKLKSEIIKLRNILEDNINLYGTSDKRVLSISKQLDEVINFYLDMSK
ncbi:MAG: Spo0E like sporulation regulatory protein [Caloramator sp.]|uniref:aspartyl-phosphate phosphatase Spo0E family protein n=1 Tax=Caloramator sp. TaxID=1871330 RepID=UPI001DF05E4D|nr:aspartyl-phosphate phosphatase Spo0E family protein [Caloramator sp.]MBZ4662965.1 Spo0E like sporulation regulatory protein [Caloramator sp.]